jgi:hypothetical protein
VGYVGDSVRVLAVPGSTLLLIAFYVQGPAQPRGAER